MAAADQMRCIGGAPTSDNSRRVDVQSRTAVAYVRSYTQNNANRLCETGVDGGLGSCGRRCRVRVRHDIRRRVDCCGAVTGGHGAAL